MRGIQAGKWAHRSVWALVLALPIGCHQNSLWSFVTDAMSPAEYPLELSDGVKKDRDVVVGVFVSHAPASGPAAAACDDKLAAAITQMLSKMAKESSMHSSRLSVINTVQVNKFKLNNPDWQKLNPVDWGESLGADYILNIRIDALSLYRPGAVNRVYDGLAEASVDVFEVRAGPQPKYHYTCLLRHPSGEPIDPAQIPEHRFQQQFLEMLAYEICLKHVR